MRFFCVVKRKGTWVGKPIASCILEYDARFLRRKRWVATSGMAFVVDLSMQLWYFLGTLTDRPLFVDWVAGYESFWDEVNASSLSLHVSEMEVGDSCEGRIVFVWCGKKGNKGWWPVSREVVHLRSVNWSRQVVFYSATLCDVDWRLRLSCKYTKRKEGLEKIEGASLKVKV